MKEKEVVATIIYQGAPREVRLRTCTSTKNRDSLQFSFHAFGERHAGFLNFTSDLVVTKYEAIDIVTQKLYSLPKTTWPPKTAKFFSDCVTAFVHSIGKSSPEVRP